MDFDLEFWLVIATVVTGLIWLAYSLFFKRKSFHRHQPLIVEYSASFFPVLLIVLILRSFVAEPFRIPSGSMIPTLEIGDFILVNKFAYGVRLPVIHTKVIDVDKPERGDVAVFRYPVDGETDYIKRVIGLPGDKIRWENKRLFINGAEVEHTPIGTFEALGQHKRSYQTLRLTETLGSIKHDIAIMENRVGLVGETTVPEGHYFMMGDNRDNSNDSRMWKFVPEENLVGKALFIWMHLSVGGDGFKPSRIGEGIK